MRRPYDIPQEEMNQVIGNVVDRLIKAGSKGVLTSEFFDPETRDQTSAYLLAVVGLETHGFAYKLIDEKGERYFATPKLHAGKNKF